MFLRHMSRSPIFLAVCCTSLGQVVVSYKKTGILTARARVGNSRHLAVAMGSIHVTDANKSGNSIHSSDYNLVAAISSYSTAQHMGTRIQRRG